MENENFSIQEIKATQRKLQKVIRVQRKSDRLMQNRDEMENVQESFRDVGLNEMTKLAEQLVKTKGLITVIRKIKNAACLSNAHIEAFFRVQNALTSLVSVLCKNESSSQLEAAACLTNLATGPHKCTRKVAIAAGPYLVTYMQGESNFLQSQCAWVAGNIANDCQHCFLILKAQGLLYSLQSLLQSQSPEVVESASFALSCCSKYESVEISESSIFVDLVLHALERTDLPHHTHVECTFILANVCLKLDQVHQLKIANRLLNQLTMDEDLDVLLATPSIRCLANLSSSSIELCNFLISNKTFRQNAIIIMNCSYHHLKNELLCALTNIATCDTAFKYQNFWEQIMKTLQPFLNPLDNSVMQVLYLLYVLKSLWPDFKKEFSNSGLDASNLYCCGKEEIEIAAKILCS